MSDTFHQSLRNPYGIPAVLADFLTLVVFLSLYLLNAFTPSGILIGFLIIAVMQILSFIPGLYRRHMLRKVFGNGTASKEP